VVRASVRPTRVSASRVRRSARSSAFSRASSASSSSRSSRGSRVTVEPSALTSRSHSVPSAFTTVTSHTPSSESIVNTVPSTAPRAVRATTASTSPDGAGVGSVVAPSSVVVDVAPDSGDGADVDVDCEALTGVVSAALESSSPPQATRARASGPATAAVVRAVRVRRMFMVTPRKVS
jgi:hypothetical protein